MNYDVFEFIKPGSTSNVDEAIAAEEIFLDSEGTERRTMKMSATEKLITFSE